MNRADNLYMSLLIPVLLVLIIRYQPLVIFHLHLLPSFNKHIFDAIILGTDFRTSAIVMIDLCSRVVRCCNYDRWKQSGMKEYNSVIRVVRRHVRAWKSKLKPETKRINRS
jgi:hypothetical protein